MARTARKATWEEKYNDDKDMERWLQLKDDGSLDSDRRLLLDLGVVLVEELRAAVEVDGSHPMLTIKNNDTSLSLPEVVVLSATTQLNEHTAEAEEL